MRSALRERGLKVNLILSGGAGRGIAHIGVIKALEEMGFEVSALSGVSAGALVSVFYAYGYTPEEMLQIVKKTRWFSLFRPKIPRSGLFSLKKAEKHLKNLIDTDRIEKLPKRVHICVTDFLKGRPLYYYEGDLIPILLGSCALPGIFEPIKYEDKVFIDGGIMNNLPVEPLEKTKGLKVGVDVNPMEETTRTGSIVNILLRSLFLAVRSNVDKRKEMCDAVIVPDILEFTLLDVMKADDLYRLGYQKTLEVMERFT